MDATDIAKKLIKPLTDGVAEILAERIAEIVSTQLKQEILEAQKYRIDKELEMKKLELEFEEYKLNSTNPNYCKIHKQFMKIFSRENGTIYYCCTVDGCDRGYNPRSPNTRQVLSKGINS